MREKIARLIRDNTMSLALSSHPHTSEKVADQILSIIKEAGYVKLAEDQSLPLIPRQDICHIIMERDTVLRKAGWRKVEIENRNNSC